MPPPPPKQPQQQQRQLQQASAAKKRALKKKEKETPAAAAKPKPSPSPSTSSSSSSSSSSTSTTPKLLLLPAPLAARLYGAHRPLGLVLGSSLLLQASVDLYESAGTAISSSSSAAAAAAATAAAALSASSSSSALLPLPGTAALTGAALGLLYACVLLPLASRTAWASPRRPLSVVVTGGSRGLGKAIAREHLLAGDSVVVASRGWEGLVKTARELSEETGAELRLVNGGGGGGEDEEEEVEEKQTSSSSSSSSSFSFSPSPPSITPIACDVSDPASVASLVAASLQRAFEKGKIDCFYNNAGESGSFRNFADSDPRTLARVVSTNLLGAVLCTRAVVEAMKKEDEAGGGSSGHIFFVEVRFRFFHFFVFFF